MSAKGIYDLESSLTDNINCGCGPDVLVNQDTDFVNTTGN